MINKIINKTDVIIENIKIFKKNKNYKNKNHLIYLYVKSYLNSKRFGNSKTKERSEIKGSTKKILKQKGSGSSRKGDIKNPIFRGGARVFGPKKRNYKIKVNKKIYKKIRNILISEKILNNKVFFIKNFEFLSFKTKYFLNFFKKLNINIKSKNKFLIITDKIYQNLLFSSRNIKNVNINYIVNLNLFNILIANYIIFIGNNIDKHIINIFLK
ncbi:MAG: 50S ribosomal protein L4 [Candidatus Shikimatogenerans bostrichidophilus]|nr:MAG: 50S ribosomal protein L4 [Candidatus Shikimatogenerans bostrichidophilus]